MRAVFAAAAAVAALVFTDTAFGGSPKDQDDCERKGEPDRSIAACTRLIKDRSETRYNLAAYYNNRGGAWRRKGDFDRAIADGTEAIRLAPKLAAAHYNRGAAWRDSGNFDRAIADFTEALRLNSKFVEALVGRGVSWSAKADPDRAIADHNEAIRLNPKVLNAYLGRGNAWFAKGDFDRAITEFDVAIRLDPKLAEAYVARGTVWTRKGDLDRAIADCNEAIRLDPKSATAHNRRGVAWRRKGDFERAIADYTTAIHLDPNNAARHANRGLAYFGKGDFSAAAADFRPSIESKNYAYLMLFRYLARARAGESATAELEANAARLKSEEWPFAAIELYLGLRTPDVTLDAADNANARCEAHFYIGEWHLLRGDQASAKSALQIAVDTCPKHFVEHFMAITELKRLTP